MTLYIQLNCLSESIMKRYRLYVHLPICLMNHLYIASNKKVETSPREIINSVASR